MSNSFGFGYDGIDLDWEMHEFVRERAWWGVLRSFDLTSRSQYWDNETQTAVDGPKWKYNDIILRMRRTEHSTMNAEDWFTRQQYTDVYNVIYYVISSVRPKKEDVIIEIEDRYKFLPQPPRLATVYETFKINHVEQKIENELIYSKCYCSKYTPKKDVTLEGAIRVNTHGITY